jgi:hypothetical protein
MARVRLKYWCPNNAADLFAPHSEPSDAEERMDVDEDDGSSKAKAKQSPDDLSAYKLDEYDQDTKSTGLFLISFGTAVFTTENSDRSI